MKKALILQGWYCKTSEHCYTWLKNELEKKEYEVYLPDLPTIHTDLPNLARQIKFVENLLKIDKDIIIVGHSLGALLALRLAEKHSFNKMFLIAGWDFDDLTEPGHRLFWKNKINHAKIKKNVGEIYCICSDNDPYTTATVNKQMSERLGGKNILLKGKGHFTEKFGVTKIPQLLKYI